MHFQWGRKPPGLRHSDRQRPQKIGKDRACGLGDMVADRQTHAAAGKLKTFYQ